MEFCILLPVLQCNLPPKLTRFYALNPCSLFSVTFISVNLYFRNSVSFCPQHSALPRWPLRECAPARAHTRTHTHTPLGGKCMGAQNTYLQGRNEFRDVCLCVPASMSLGHTVEGAHPGGPRGPSRAQVKLGYEELCTPVTADTPSPCPARGQLAPAFSELPQHTTHPHPQGIWPRGRTSGPEQRENSGTRPREGPREQRYFKIPNESPHTSKKTFKM